jgi:hypothetical protein
MSESVMARYGRGVGNRAQSASCQSHSSVGWGCSHPRRTPRNATIPLCNRPKGGWSVASSGAARVQYAIDRRSANPKRFRDLQPVEPLGGAQLGPLGPFCCITGRSTACWRFPHDSEPESASGHRVARRGCRGEVSRQMNNHPGSTRNCADRAPANCAWRASGADAAASAPAGTIPCHFKSRACGRSSVQLGMPRRGRPLLHLPVNRAMRRHLACAPAISFSILGSSRPLAVVQKLLHFGHLSFQRGVLGSQRVGRTLGLRLVPRVRVFELF